MIDLENLGRSVAEIQDEDRRELGGLDRAAAGFVSALRRRPVYQRPAAKLLAAAIVLTGMVVALWSTRWRRAPAALLAPPAVAVGQPVSAPPDRTIPLDFPGGSRVVLAAGTEAVVHELTETGARVEVTRGDASVAVHHEANTRWLFSAGPYRVRVVGTRFDLGWSPGRERFELKLHEGSVVVTGEGTAHAAVTMVAPEQLAIDHGKWQLSSAADSAVADSAPSRSTPAAPSVAPAAGSAVAPSSGGQDWTALATAGKYAEAYGLAARQGIRGLAATETSGNLLGLAETCRFTGHPDESSMVLMELRHRFPGTDDAAVAAFQLGRRGGAAAAQWFRSYLAERPQGALAREASGRLLEALDRTGDRAAAVEAANAYLLRYPTGPHAAFARQLLTR